MRERESESLMARLTVGEIDCRHCQDIEMALSDRQTNRGHARGGGGGVLLSGCVCVCVFVRS